MANLQNGRTALMAAVEGGHKKVVEILLDLETLHLCDTNIQEKVYVLTCYNISKAIATYTGVRMDCSPLCC